MDKEQLKLKWESDPDLRAEFLNDEQAFYAYSEAEQKGKFRIAKGGIETASGPQNRVQRWTNSEGGSVTIRTGKDADKSTDEQLQAEWNSNRALWNEFEDFEEYKAFVKNQHKVKVQGGRK